ncbi:hypothetical protein BsWGS_14459 [Bradybaena similaris]
MATSGARAFRYLLERLVIECCEDVLLFVSHPPWICSVGLCCTVGNSHLLLSRYAEPYARFSLGLADTVCYNLTSSVVRSSSGLHKAIPPSLKQGMISAALIQALVLITHPHSIYSAR